MTYSWENICFTLDIHLLAPSTASHKNSRTSIADWQWLFSHYLAFSGLFWSGCFLISQTLLPMVRYREGINTQDYFYIVDKLVWRTLGSRKQRSKKTWLYITYNIIHHTLYTIYHTVYSKRQNIICTLYMIHYTLYNIQSTLHINKS